VLTGFFHASFTVADIERSKRFYGETLGLELVHAARHDKPYTGVQVGFPGAILEVAAFRIPGVEPQASSHVLELVEYVEPRGVQLDTRSNNVGASHVCFVPDDIHAEHARLASLGVEFVSPPVEITHGPNAGGFTAYLRDPDGNGLELLQGPAAS
jgi:catechol 2,3-dioxygenase-like lactoylglutathione lyase family enzyme